MSCRTTANAARSSSPYGSSGFRLGRDLGRHHGEQGADRQQAVLEGVEPRREHRFDVDGAQCARVEPAAVLEQRDGLGRRRDLSVRGAHPVDPLLDLGAGHRAAARASAAASSGAAAASDHAQQSPLGRRPSAWPAGRQVEGDADRGADQRVQDAGLGGDVVVAHAQDEHGADRGLQGLLAQAQGLGQHQRGGDRGAQAPPGQPEPRWTGPSPPGRRTAPRRPGQRPS